MVPRYSINFTWRDLRYVWRASQRSINETGTGLWHHLGFSQHGMKWTVDGRTALRLLLRAARVSPGEPVVVPRLTCEQVHRAIISEGAKLCFVDIRPGEFAPTADDYAVAQSESGARFVVAISYWGLPLDTSSLRAKLGGSVRIIQDCALSFGSWQQGVHDGVSADAAFFSFGPGKPLCLGLGGALVWRRSAFPDLEQRLQEGLTLLPCPELLAKRALLRTFLKAMLFKDGVAYRLARNVVGREARGGRILSRDDSPLVSGPIWMGHCSEARWQSVESGARLRKKRLDQIRGLLAESGCRFPACEGNGGWNHWICPFLLPEGRSAATVAAFLARYGFESRSPYTGEMTWDALQGLGSKQLPNWLVTSSLDLLKGEKLDRFAVTLKEALKHG